MSSTRFDVVGLGNAIVDVLARSQDDDLVREGLQKGTMALIDEDRAEALYAGLGPTVLMSGGSAANTINGVASLGGKAAFIGKVKDDDLGRSFAHDLRAAGVHYSTPFAADGAATARCLVLVTPDGERTMNTFLGASQGLGPDDVDAAVVADSSYVYLEGYLWDPPAAKEAFRRAADIAHDAGRQVALTLSDVFCVDRHRAEFLDLVRSGKVDIVFANESEAHALYETSDFNSAVEAFRKDAKLAVITRSEKGSLIVTRDGTQEVGAAPVAQVVDATGAGDLFAAGFLVGLARDLPAEDCARLGALAAAEIISHMGARPETDLKQLATQSGLLK